MLLRYCMGVMPVFFRNVRLKLLRFVKPFFAAMVFKDASGSGNDGINHDTVIENGEAVFNGESSYIEMPAGLLENADAASISVTFKNQTENNVYKWLWAFGNDTDNNFYLNPSVPWGPAIIAMKKEGINNGNEMQIDYSEGFKKSDEYVTVTVMLNGENSAMYANGKLLKTGSFSIKPSELGYTTLNYIGKSFYSSDALFKGAISDFKIYNYALTENGIIYDLALAQGDDKAALEFLKAWAAPDNADYAMRDLTLPEADYEKDGFGLSWSSSDTEYISDNGKILKRPETGNVTVDLTMNIKFKGDNIAYTVPVTIPGLDKADYTLNITDEKGVDIQDTMWGLFFEDISRAADGGLYAETLYNCSFENFKANDNPTVKYGDDAYVEEPGYMWSSAEGTMEYKTDVPLDENNRHYLEFTGTSFENDAYDGIYLDPSKTYNVSLYARTDGYSGDITASVAKDGVTYGSVKLAAEDSAFNENGWQKYSGVLTPAGEICGAKFVITLDASATVDFDMISMKPSDALYGVFRPDLVEMLKDMEPGFLRFPGGCVAEGFNESNR